MTTLCSNKALFTKAESTVGRPCFVTFWSKKRATTNVRVPGAIGFGDTRKKGPLSQRLGDAYFSVTLPRLRGGGTPGRLCNESTREPGSLAAPSGAEAAGAGPWLGMETRAQGVYHGCPGAALAQPLRVLSLSVPTLLTSLHLSGGVCSGCEIGSSPVCCLRSPRTRLRGVPARGLSAFGVPSPTREQLLTMRSVT